MYIINIVSLALCFVCPWFRQQTPGHQFTNISSVLKRFVYLFPHIIYDVCIFFFMFIRFIQNHPLVSVAVYMKIYSTIKLYVFKNIRVLRVFDQNVIKISGAINVFLFVFFCSFILVGLWM